MHRVSTNVPKIKGGGGAAASSVRHGRGSGGTMDAPRRPLAASIVGVGSPSSVSTAKEGKKEGGRGSSGDRGGGARWMWLPEPPVGFLHAGVVVSCVRGRRRRGRRTTTTPKEEAPAAGSGAVCRRRLGALRRRRASVPRLECRAVEEDGDVARCPRSRLEEMAPGVGDDAEDDTADDDDDDHDRGGEEERLVPSPAEEGARGRESWHTRRRRDRWSRTDLERLPAECRPWPDETLDLILRRKVLLLQSRRGYRANTDSQLLAFFACRRREQSRGEQRTRTAPIGPRVMDLGAGNGLVSVLYGRSHPDASLVLVELQESLAKRASRNLALHDLRDRSQVVLHDLADDLPTDLQDTMDVVLCNPPFYSDEDRRSRPTRPEKMLAHYESTATIDAFLHAAKQALRPNSAEASAFFIYDAVYTSRLTDAVEKAGLKTIARQTVHHRADHPPLRTILELKRSEAVGSTPSCEELPRLVLHPEGTSEKEYGQDMEDYLASLPSLHWKVGQLRDDYQPHLD